MNAVLITGLVDAELCWDSCEMYFKIRLAVLRAHNKKREGRNETALARLCGLNTSHGIAQEFNICAEPTEKLPQIPSVIAESITSDQIYLVVIQK